MYLIDGNNLIGHTEGLSLENPNCRQALIDLLIPFCKKEEVVLFFDGPKTTLRRTDRAKIRFSGPTKADDLIRREIERVPTPGNLDVVSSDNEIYDHAKSSGAEAWRCEQFAELLPPLRRNTMPREAISHSSLTLKHVWQRPRPKKPQAKRRKGGKQPGNNRAHTALDEALSSTQYPVSKPANWQLALKDTKPTSEPNDWQAALKGIKTGRTP